METLQPSSFCCHNATAVDFFVKFFGRVGKEGGVLSITRSENKKLKKMETEFRWRQQQRLLAEGSLELQVLLQYFCKQGGKHTLLHTVQAVDGQPPKQVQNERHF